MPNQTWQSDFTHYRLTRPDGRPGTDVEIITWLDDCTRYALHVTAHHRVTTPIVHSHLPRNRRSARHPRLHPDRQRHGLHRPPRRRPPAAATPSSNELRDLARGPEELPTQPPHHLRQGRTVPADHEEVAARPTRPAQHDRRAPGPPRPLRRRVQPPPTAPLPAPPGDPGSALRLDAQGATRPGHATPTPTTGSATTASTRPAPSPCAYNGRLHHIGIGRTHAGTYVILLVQDLDIRVVNATTGELLRELILDPNRDYQPTGAPKGPTRTPEMTTAEPAIAGPAVADVLRHHTVGLTGFEPATSLSPTSALPSCATARRAGKSTGAKWVL